MDTLFSLFPDADELLKVQPEDLAPVLLTLALPQVQSAGFIPSAVTQVSPTDAHAGRDYPFYKRQPVDQLINRTWNLIEREGFIEPSSGMNGQNGWRIFTDKGEAVAKGQDMQKHPRCSCFSRLASASRHSRDWPLRNHAERQYGVNWRSDGRCSGSFGCCGGRGSTSWWFQSQGLRRASYESGVSSRRPTHGRP
jgi:hypothetical protein